MAIGLYYFSFDNWGTEFAFSNNLTDYLHYIFSKGDFMPFRCMISGHNISYEFSYDKDSNIIKFMFTDANQLNKCLENIDYYKKYYKLDESSDLIEFFSRHYNDHSKNYITVHLSKVITFMEKYFEGGEYYVQSEKTILYLIIKKVHLCENITLAGE